MPVVEHVALYDELLDTLAETSDADRVLAFRLSGEKQARLDELLERNRRGVLTEDESRELDEYEHVEHLVRMLKARLLQRRSRRLNTSR